jgi:hypothetical protein
MVKFLDYSARIIASTALLIGVATLVSYPIVFTTRPQASLRLLQQGNCTWQVTANTVVIAQSTYSLYEYSNSETYGTVIELDPLAQPLSTGVASYNASNVQYQIKAFSPVISQLAPYGLQGYIFPLRLDTVSTFVASDSCLSGACYLNGANSLSSNSSFAFANGMIVFYVSRTDGLNSQFANFTLTTSRKIRVTLINL